MCGEFNSLNSPANANQTEKKRKLKIENVFETTKKIIKTRSHVLKRKNKTKINAFITKFESDFNFVFNLYGFIHNIDRSEANLESVFLVPRNFYKQFF